MLKEYLETVKGKTICIGCDNGSGWFYYGECFDGIENLIQLLSTEEQKRLEFNDRRAILRYNNRAQLFEKLISIAEHNLKRNQVILDNVRNRHEGMNAIMKAQDDVDAAKAKLKNLTLGDGRERFYQKLEEDIDNADNELKGFVPFLEANVVSDSKSLLNPGAIRVLINGTMTGKYWLKEECDADLRMKMLKVHARRDSE